MPRIRAFLSLLIACAALAALLAPRPARAGDARLPLAENVLFFVDHSGSMNMRTPKDDRYKIAMAKDLLAELGRELPEGFANTGLYAFAPYQELLPPQPHRHMAFAKAVARIGTEYNILGRRTPMGRDLARLDAVIEKLPGRTALVVLSDGYSNQGSDPVAELERLYAKYGGNLQVHIVNYADKARGKRTIQGMRKLSAPFSYTWGDMILDNGPLRARFIEQTFLAKPPPPLDPPMASAPEELPPDRPLDMTVRLPRLNDPFGPLPEPEPEAEEPERPVETVRAGAETIVLRHWRMGFGRADIPEAMVPALIYVLALMAENPEVKVMVEGHTDNLGARAYNVKLSQARARAVRDWLVNAGIAPSRVMARGLGPDKPVYDNGTRIGRSLNRRVVIRRDISGEES